MSMLSGEKGKGGQKEKKEKGVMLTYGKLNGKINNDLDENASKKQILVDQRCLFSSSVSKKGGPSINDAPPRFDFNCFDRARDFTNP